MIFGSGQFVDDCLNNGYQLFTKILKIKTYFEDVLWRS